MSVELVCSLCHGTQPWREDAMGYINQESNLYVSWFGMLEYSCLCGNMFFNASLNLFLEKWKCMCSTHLRSWLVDQNRFFLAFFPHSSFHRLHYPLLKIIPRTMSEASFLNLFEYACIIYTKQCPFGHVIKN